MNSKVVFTKRQRSWLWVVAILGFVGPNGVFLYCALYRWSDLLAALNNPVALAFIGDTFVAMALLAYLFAKWGVGRLPSIWFIILSLVGGLMFSIPAFVLIGSRED